LVITNCCCPCGCLQLGPGCCQQWQQQPGAQAQGGHSVATATWLATDSGPWMVWCKGGSSVAPTWAKRACPCAQPLQPLPSLLVVRPRQSLAPVNHGRRANQSWFRAHATNHVHNQCLEHHSIQPWSSMHDITQPLALPGDLTTGELRSNTPCWSSGTRNRVLQKIASQAHRAPPPDWPASHTHTCCARCREPCLQGAQDSVLYRGLTTCCTHAPGAASCWVVVRCPSVTC
jgi:hypothetical protein